MKINRENFWKAMDQARVRTFEDLSRRTGVRAQTISSAVRGMEIKPKKAAVLAVGLGVDVSELAEGR